MKLTVEKTKNPKAKPDWDHLCFGKTFTDHMFLMEYDEQGWHDPRIIPYGPFQLEPSTMVLHYGQSVFEGLKAYKTQDGRTLLFRPSANFTRMNVSAERLCIPKIDVDFSVEVLKTLVKMEEDWIPKADGTSLYIRPFIFATDPHIGVKASSTYYFNIILSPVGAYYEEGLAPVKIYVEDEYVRAVKGGMGFTKTAGNYAASLLAGEIAAEKGYAQVLWLDGIHKKYVEEVGSMNIFFKFKDELVTPALNGSILSGITRDSIIHMAKDMGLTVNERQISIEEIYDRHKQGELEEVFGSGTAAVVSPVSELNWEGKIIAIGGGKMGELTKTLYDKLTGIQWGKIPDPYGWTVAIK